MQNKLTKFGIGTLTIGFLVSLGFILPSDATHFCRPLEIGKYCNHLSSSEKTCYPTPTNTKGKVCPNKWELLSSMDNQSTQESFEYCCNTNGCFEKKNKYC